VHENLGLRGRYIVDKTTPKKILKPRSALLLLFIYCFWGNSRTILLSIYLICASISCPIFTPHRKTKVLIEPRGIVFPFLLSVCDVVKVGGAHEIGQLWAQSPISKQIYWKGSFHPARILKLFFSFFISFDVIFFYIVVLICIWIYCIFPAGAT